MRRLIIARSSSLVMMKRKIMTKTKCGQISCFFWGVGVVGHVLKRSNFFIVNPLPLRTEWERERENQRDCHSSLSSGETSYPHEGPEESYSYQPLHQEPSRKSNNRYPSTDSLVNTLHCFYTVTITIRDYPRFICYAVRTCYALISLCNVVMHC